MRCFSHRCNIHKLHNPIHLYFLLEFWRPVFFIYLLIVLFSPPRISPSIPPPKSESKFFPSWPRLQTHVLIMWPWEDHLISLSLSFLFCNTGGKYLTTIAVVHTEWDNTWKMQTMILKTYQVLSIFFFLSFLPMRKTEKGCKTEKTLDHTASKWEMNWGGGNLSPL